jgi:hypothetical protein
MKARRAQREKPTFVTPAATEWFAANGGYFLQCEPVDARLEETVTEFRLTTPIVWQMKVRIGTQWYKGTRPTLEEAFKAADRLIYEKAKDVWLKSKATAVTSNFAGILEAPNA